jgi:HAD superfamily hydrolase (TIGR01509 family)
MSVRALIFDVDGTLAETEELHRIAFNRAFAEAGIPWRWDRELYAELLKVTGGRERIEAYTRRTGAQEIDAPALHRRKTELYNEMMVPGAVELRPGIEDLLRRARDAGLDMAIATTTRRSNVVGLMRATLGEAALGWFRAIRTGEDTSRKKPDPEVFQLVLSDLGHGPDECLIFEDSENGLRAAQAVKVPVVITPSIYTGEDDFSGADYIFKNLDEPFSILKFVPEFVFHDVSPDVRDLLFHG